MQPTYDTMPTPPEIHAPSGSGTQSRVPVSSTGATHAPQDGVVIQLVAQVASTKERLELTRDDLKESRERLYKKLDEVQAQLNGLNTLKTQVEQIPKAWLFILSSLTGAIALGFQLFKPFPPIAPLPSYQPPPGYQMVLIPEVKK